MSDIEWQIRNWYNFTWLCGDSLVEQAVHNADKIMWLMHDKPPLSAVAWVAARCRPTAATSTTTSRSTIRSRMAIACPSPTASRRAASTARSTTYGDRRHAACSGAASRASKRRTASQVAVRQGEEYDMYQREHDVLFAAIRAGKPKNDDLNLATSTLLALMGRHAAYSGQQVTWEQALNSHVSLVPKPVDWNGKHEVPALAHPGRSQVFLQALMNAHASFGLSPPRPLSPWRRPRRCRAASAAAPSAPKQPAHRRRRCERDGGRPAHPYAHRGAGEEGANRQTRPLQRHDPEYDDLLQHGAGAGGRVPDGIGGRRRQAGRAAAAQGPARCVLDAGARGDLGRVPACSCLPTRRRSARSRCDRGRVEPADGAVSSR